MYSHARQLWIPYQNQFDEKDSRTESPLVRLFLSIYLDFEAAYGAPLQTRLSTGGWMHNDKGLLAGDEEEGNGGAEILQTLIGFCHHADPPREEFKQRA